jgi:ribosomal protein S18 acetylase RimI-like enzyme
MDAEFLDEHLIAKHLKEAAVAANRCAEQAFDAKKLQLFRYFASRVKELYRLALVSDPEVHARGVPLPSPWREDQGIAHVVNTDVENDLSDSLDVVGEVLRREANFAVNPFFHVNNLEACLWITEGRAAGAIIYHEAEGRFQWLDETEDLGEMSAPIIGESTRALQIVGVWVARDHRQRGIAKMLALALAELNELEPHRFLHTGPLTASGHAFATSVSGGRVRMAVKRE